MTVSVAVAFGGLAGWFVRRLDRRFDAIDKRFDVIDKRFDVMDKRFDVMDKRFDAVDRRFEAIDRRFEHLEGNVIGELRAEVQHGFEVAREERKRLDTRLDTRLDNLVRRTEELSDQIGDVRQSLGRLEGVLLGGPGLEPLPGARPG